MPIIYTKKVSNRHLLLSPIKSNAIKSGKKVYKVIINKSKKLIKK
ncbi:hypothetical protein OMAG_000185 [Candidatus Omnitrophus magneticus]|uniref:Uncharacterized protein n=1 Tax=Candidatus Omnitrophus magneticus TaxID=1609969 RepID=A0A0F0CRN6_9BACT|nr:hypothetical protein OMAG_000185 [Candidatus Omnitrophus magneticus]